AAKAIVGEQRGRILDRHGPLCGHHLGELGRKLARRGHAFDFRCRGREVRQLETVAQCRRRNEDGRGGKGEEKGLGGHGGRPVLSFEWDRALGRQYDNPIAVLTSCRTSKACEDLLRRSPAGGCSRRDTMAITQRIIPHLWFVKQAEDSWL